MRNVILDVDTGNDDAVAIMMAAMSPQLNLLGCTTVAGNLPVDNTTDNTLRVLDYIGCGDVPVHRGLAKPFAPSPFPVPEKFVSSAVRVHQPQLALPEATTPAQSESAVEWLVETLRAATDKVTLVPVAPLTNIAAAVTIAPDIVGAVDEIIIMGGSASHGNETSQAEFNFYVDPVAAHVVLNAGFDRLVLVTLDATRQALVSAAQCLELANSGTPAAKATAEILDYYIRANVGREAAPVHDALCVAYAIDPSVIDVERLSVTVDTIGFHTYGRTVVDLKSAGSPGTNAYVSHSADSERFFELLHGTLTGATTLSAAIK